MNREHEIECYLRRRIRERGGDTRKWVSPGRPGVPDQIVILHGRVIFVEVKTMQGKISPAQSREMDRIRGLGAEVDVVFGIKSVDDFVERLSRG